MTPALEIRQILFPTDFSDASGPAGATAADLARRFGARLHVLHVVPPVTDPTPAPPALRAVADDVGRGLPIVTAITSGRPARQIADYARENAIDLIVLGTHGRTGVSRALLGSVAEAVVRRAPCRVLTVPTELPPTPRRRQEAAEVEPPSSCLVCGVTVAEELVCEACRAKIRGEALQGKLRAEHGGR
jgi:universal stress protein A